MSKKFQDLKIGDLIFSTTIGWHTYWIGKILCRHSNEHTIMFLADNGKQENYPEFIYKSDLNKSFTIRNNIYICADKDLFIKYLSERDVDCTLALDKIYKMEELWE